jgi:hypothetical protein
MNYARLSVLRRHLSVFPSTLPPSLQAPCIRWTQKPSTSLELYHPTAFTDQSALLRTPGYPKASEVRCAVLQKSHTQGLATLSVASATLTLGSLFQLPTLLGFALQSFTPSSWSGSISQSTLPPLRFPTKPSQASYRRSNGLLPQEKPCPSYRYPED